MFKEGNQRGFAMLSYAMTTLASSAPAVLASLAIATSAHAATDIQFWHSMSGALGDRVNELSTRFNASQSDYKVVPVFKGTYDESMAAAIAAFRAGSAPHVLQVFEVGTATMMSAKKAIKPVYQMMQEAGEPWDPKGYIPAIIGYYTDPQGNMLSFPFNSSTPVFFYSKDAFKRAGLDPNKPPVSWEDVRAAAEKIRNTNAAACGFTTGWQSWVQLETMSAWHNEPFATKNNGFGGLDAELVFNTQLMVRHISNLASWHKAGWFSYGGRRNEPEAKFTSGECAMLTSSSAAYGTIARTAKFDFAVSQLPYYPDWKGAPQNSIIGGASLWVMAGKKAPEYKGVAKFFSFLSQPQIQADWYQPTGYLPITQAAYQLGKTSGFYAKTPAAEVSVKQMLDRNPTVTSKGIRLGNFVQIRGVIDEELEAVWAGKKAPKEALDEAVKRGNDLLRKFQQANR